MIKRSDYDRLINKNALFESLTLAEEYSVDNKEEYDLFISYSSNDYQYAIGTIKLLENMYNRYKKNKKGFVVYLDRYDSKLDPNNVNEETANRLHNVLKKCKSLLYIHSQNSELSKWCPWEIGIAQGLDKPISVIEIVDDEGTYDTKQIYISMYPTIIDSYIKNEREKGKVFWVMDRKHPEKYIIFCDYVNGSKSFIR